MDWIHMVQDNKSNISVNTNTLIKTTTKLDQVCVWFVKVITGLITD
jgi:hypothetical protein